MLQMENNDYTERDKLPDATQAIYVSVVNLQRHAQV